MRYAIYQNHQSIQAFVSSFSLLSNNPEDLSDDDKLTRCNLAKLINFLLIAIDSKILLLRKYGYILLFIIGFCNKITYLNDTYIISKHIVSNFFIPVPYRVEETKGKEQTNLEMSLFIQTMKQMQTVKQQELQHTNATINKFIDCFYKSDYASVSNAFSALLNLAGRKLLLKSNDISNNIELILSDKIIKCIVGLFKTLPIGANEIKFCVEFFRKLCIFIECCCNHQTINKFEILFNRIIEEFTLCLIPYLCDIDLDTTWQKMEYMHSLFDLLNVIYSNLDANIEFKFMGNGNATKLFSLLIKYITSFKKDSLFVAKSNTLIITLLQWEQFYGLISQNTGDLLDYTIKCLSDFTTSSCLQDTYYIEQLFKILDILLTKGKQQIAEFTKTAISKYLSFSWIIKYTELRVVQIRLHAWTSLSYLMSYELLTHHPTLVESAIKVILSNSECYGVKTTALTFLINCCKYLMQLDITESQEEGLLSIKSFKKVIQRYSFLSNIKAVLEQKNMDITFITRLMEFIKYTVIIDDEYTVECIGQLDLWTTFEGIAKYDSILSFHKNECKELLISKPIIHINVNYAMVMAEIKSVVDLLIEICLKHYKFVEFFAKSTHFPHILCQNLLKLSEQIEDEGDSMKAIYGELYCSCANWIHLLCIKSKYFQEIFNTLDIEGNKLFTIILRGMTVSNLHQSKLSGLRLIGYLIIQNALPINEEFDKFNDDIIQILESSLENTLKAGIPEEIDAIFNTIRPYSNKSIAIKESCFISNIFTRIVKFISDTAVEKLPIESFSRATPSKSKILSSTKKRVNSQSIIDSRSKLDKKEENKELSIKEPMQYNGNVNNAIKLLISTITQSSQFIDKYSNQIQQSVMTLFKYYHSAYPYYPLILRYYITVASQSSGMRDLLYSKCSGISITEETTNALLNIDILKMNEVEKLRLFELAQVLSLQKESVQLIQKNKILEKIFSKIPGYHKLSTSEKGVARKSIDSFVKFLIGYSYSEEGRSYLGAKKDICEFFMTIVLECNCREPLFMHILQMFRNMSFLRGNKLRFIQNQKFVPLMIDIAADPENNMQLRYSAISLILGLLCNHQGMKTLFTAAEINEINELYKESQRACELQNYQCTIEQNTLSKEMEIIKKMNSNLSSLKLLLSEEKDI